MHKSQGLTFDNVVLDLANTFAAGQLYVALSRCRSLEGMTLLSKIKPENVITENKVVSFYEAANDLSNVDEQLSRAKEVFEREQLLKAFRHDKILSYMDQWQDTLLEKDIPNKADSQRLINDVRLATQKLAGVANNFIFKMSNYFDNEKVDKDFVRERVSKAIDYFTEQLHAELVTPLVKHEGEYSVKKNSRGYLSQIEDIEVGLHKFIKRIYRVHYLDKKVYTGEEIYLSSNPPKKKKKLEKGATYDITYKMHKDGKSINAIAKDRGLSVGTIETHIAKLIKEQKVSIFDVMKDKRVEKALTVAQSYPDLNLSELIKKVPFRVTFGELRWVMYYRDILEGRG